MNFCVLPLIILIWNVMCSHGSDVLKRSELEENEGVRYFTYTRENKTVAADIRDVNFNDKYVNVFIIHCFDSKSLDKPLQIKDDLFQYKVDVGRVIIVSWLDYSYTSDPSSITIDKLQNNYDEAVRYFVPLLAEDLYEKIVHIRQNGAHTVELIGHGVGAHVAGQTGKLSRSQPINRIFGLNPTGRFFKERKDLALNDSDASNVVVLHTNINVYGFGSEIGTSDIKVNGGKKQPNCKVSVDLCSHNEAWNSCSQYLKEKLINQDEAQIHPYVICLDDSDSMNDNKRLIRAVHSARQVISNLKRGSFIGIVNFNSRAEKLHDIVEIKSNVERTSLQSSFPIKGRNATSIGAGLRLSMNMLKAMRNTTQFCSTIVLLSDGEQNHGESPKDVLKDLQNECIIVNSIAMGQNASEELEQISSSTGGVVSYAMEDGTSQEIIGVIQAFTYTFESGTYADDTLVHLLSKEVTLSSSENEVQYIIDDTTGEDTEFKFVSYDLDKVEVKLISPNVEVFTSSSSEYFYDDFAKGFRISDAVPGSWNFTVSKISKSKRSIESPIFGTVVANTHQLNDNGTIRLNADVSSRVLEYPKPITIRAELRNGEFPVIHAEVFANIKAPNQTIIRLQLYDNGVFPDDLANDGIYTTDIKKLPKPERYSVIVTALSDGTAMLVPKKINYFLKDVVDCKQISCQKLKAFEREVDVGSIKLLSKNNEDKIPPGKVYNLRGMIQSETEKLIALEWTSPKDESCSIIRYDIRALINGTNFENGVKFNTSDVVQGSLEAEICTITKVVNIVVKIPDHIWHYVTENMNFEIKFALKSVAPNNVQSDRSNIARVTIKDNKVSSACSQLRSGNYNLMLLFYTGKLLQTFYIIVLLFLFNIFI